MFGCHSTWPLHLVSQTHTSVVGISTFLKMWITIRVGCSTCGDLLIVENRFKRIHRDLLLVENKFKRIHRDSLSFAIICRNSNVTGTHNVMMELIIDSHHTSLMQSSSGLTVRAGPWWEYKVSSQCINCTVFLLNQLMAAPNQTYAAILSDHV